jgi:hypothetical protein
MEVQSNGGLIDVDVCFFFFNGDPWFPMQFDKY